MVKTNWTEDYYNMHKEAVNQMQTSALFGRRRTPFVPFVMTNETGNTLWFCTQTRMSGSMFGPSRTRAHSGVETKWLEVHPGQALPFTFEGRGKLRHMNTHDMKIHQVIVRVDGWQEVTPVSVDRVGTYFRKALPLSMSSDDDSPPARVVFEVSLDGSARKMIKVRSALLVENKLSTPVDLKLENTALRSKGCQGTDPATDGETTDTVELHLG